MEGNNRTVDGSSGHLAPSAASAAGAKAVFMNMSFLALLILLGAGLYACVQMQRKKNRQLRRDCDDLVVKF